ncbi:hypothetical protein AVEN_23806-1 [Araneus ventricosus]|uniref:Uncharacterized protein n=1 Tax=Araneus ventricosus TaxID=182803 RepID=A0A4Y2LW90_ARAVE|nr:hypothetical protein AVEN_8371-1 [Araneus ventricosus]GBN19094.1 hypothetical protein AVEN_23806-1 [Araneus ventricosus]
MGTLSMPIDEAAETPKCSPGTSNTVSPLDISPVSNIKKRTTSRGRKATRSSLITGSPYKDQLTKSLEKSAPKKTSLSVPGLIFPEFDRRCIITKRFISILAKGRERGEGGNNPRDSTWKWKDQPPQFNSVLPHFGNYLPAPTAAKPIAPCLHPGVTRPLGCVTR